MKPTAIYADGGVIGRNPSMAGGTYAWAHITEESMFKSGSGLILPGEIGLLEVTNNVSEFIALVAALEAAPPGWYGHVYSDSQITLGRLFNQWKLGGLPMRLVQRGTAAMQRVDMAKCTPILLDGHPTRAQLAAGIGKRGGPVSVWNVWCDTECNRLAKESRQVAESVT